MTTVLHLIPALTRGGPSRALLTAARSTAGPELEHAIASLAPADPWMTRECDGHGVSVSSAPSAGSLRAMLENAGIVQIHFWNSPALYELLSSDLPAIRLLVWSHVSGEHAPQVIPPALIEFADVVLASCDYTTELPGLEHLDVLPAVAGWDRLRGIRRNAGAGFTVGFIGTLDFAKLHPELISMCASIPVPHARFLICGTGGAMPVLRRQAAEQGIADRVEFRGFVEDIGGAVAEMDVFGYPLAEGTYAASELVLQEAMYAGVPPVVLGPAAVRRSVVHGETGLTVSSTREYQQAVVYFHNHPEERVRMGRAAHEYAVRTWSPEAVAGRWAETYAALLERPKRRRPRYPIGEGGAPRFVQSLGGAAPHFAASLSSAEDAIEAERQIARSPMVVATGGGGVLYYRDHYPGDPHLRLWSGLVLHGQGHPGLAAGEFSAAIRLGLDHWRVSWYLALAAEAAGQTAVMEEALRAVPKPLPPVAEGVFA
ncbi:MAG: glycosyltransferase [Actinobacteria bacterium]|nr:MAG: glycosyltransferase [Actinomycetota bacterium]